MRRVLDWLENHIHGVTMAMLMFFYAWTADYAFLAAFCVVNLMRDDRP